MADNNMFSGLEKLGLGMLSEMDLYEEEGEKETTPAETATKQEIKKHKEEDALFDKGYCCPVCDSNFKVRSVRVGKARMIGSDIDLRPRYEDIDPIKYDVIVCSHCGYASLSRYFAHITPPQIKLIRTSISPYFKGIDDKGKTYSYDEAIMRYELALANSVVKKSKASEKAYACLKIAWLKRGQAENLPEEMQERDKKLTQLKNEEKTYIKKAYEGFLVAMAKEMFPICGMDEWTYTYLVAELGYECEDYAKSLKLLSDLVVSKVASPKLKDKARDLRRLMQNKV